MFKDPKGVAGSVIIQWGLCSIPSRPRACRVASSNYPTVVCFRYKFQPKLQVHELIILPPSVSLSHHFSLLGALIFGAGSREQMWKPAASGSPEAATFATLERPTENLLFLFVNRDSTGSNTSNSGQHHNADWPVTLAQS